MSVASFMGYLKRKSTLMIFDKYSNTDEGGKVRYFFEGSIVI